MNHSINRVERRLFLVALSALLSACADVGDDVSLESSTASSTAALVSKGGLDATLVTQSIWNDGYCGEVVLTNHHPTAAVSAWQVSVDIASMTIQNNWSANAIGSTGAVSFTPKDWNTTIAPGGTTRFGFCARSASNAVLPTVMSVTDNLPTGSCVESQPTFVPSRVQMRVSNIDDFVYLTVNGIRSKTWQYGDSESGQIVDVTPWFVNGNNEVRIQAANTGGPVNYTVEMWVDGNPILTETCPSEICNSSLSQSTGIWYDRKVTVPLTSMPEAQVVTFNSATSGPIYVNGQYTGLRTPNSLRLAPGTYTFGLGRSVDTPGNYSGAFYEESVSVGTCPKAVTLDAHGPLPITNTTKVAILPIRTTMHGDMSDVGVLPDSDIAYLYDQTRAIDSTWVRPFSYGLTQWEIATLPVVENAILERGPSCMDAPNTGLLLEDAGLTALRDQYDILIFLYSSYHADGTNVAHEPCAIWAGGREISYYNGWMRSIPRGAPSEGLLHESLHSYEWYNGWQRGYYNGVDGLHGAEEHGYTVDQGGESGWLAWYRAFSRNQVAELDNMRNDVVWPSIPTTADLYVGVFDTLRYGTSSVPSGISAVSTLSALVKASSVMPTTPEHADLAADIEISAP